MLSGNIVPELPPSQALRISFWQRKTDNQSVIHPSQLRLDHANLICHRTIAAGAEEEFIVPEDKGGNGLIVRIDALDNGKLIYSGQRHNVNLQDSEVEVFAHRVGARSCSYTSLRVRAFHAATLLPNGQVLVTGGILGPEDPAVISGDTVLANGEVDVFDPSTLSWRNVSNPSADSSQIPGRAFHEAVLLTSKPEGPYRVLLVGGIMGKNPGDPVAILRRSTSSLGLKQPFLFTPGPSAKPAGLAIVTYDPETSSISYQPLEKAIATLMPAIAVSADQNRMLIAGGAAGYVPEGDEQGFTADPPVAQWVDLPSDLGPPRLSDPIPLSRIRVGHTAAEIDDRFIVLGGNMDGTETELTEQAAEIAAPGGTFTAVELPSDVDPTAWHTLTPLGQDDTSRAPPKALLWAGGFRLELDRQGRPLSFTTSPQNRPLQIVERAGNGLKTTVPQVPRDGFVAAAYHAAVPLQDGSVLLTGGNLPRLDNEQNPGTCQVEGQEEVTIFCPLDQLAIFGLEAGTANTGEVHKLTQPRFGHRATRLLDDTVLITGGIRLNKDLNPELINEAELFSPPRGDIHADKFNEDNRCQLRSELE